MAIKNLNRCIKRFDSIARGDITPYINEGVTLVQSTAKSLVDVDTGGLRASIHPDVKKTSKKIIGRVYTASEYAMFKEFGTGITGNGTYPYPINDSIQYKGKKSYRDTPWVYTPDGGETFYHTEGMPARPYMYPALNNNKEKVRKIIEDGQRAIHKKAKGR